VAWLALSAACHTFRPVSHTRLSSAEPPPRIWVTRADHSTLVLESPHLDGDTLTGLVYGETLAMPVAHAVVIRTRVPAPVRTVAVALISSAATFGMLWYMEHRPDVGYAEICTDGTILQNKVKCCLVSVDNPC